MLVTFTELFEHIHPYTLTKLQLHLQYFFILQIWKIAKSDYYLRHVYLSVCSFVRME